MKLLTYLQKTYELTRREFAQMIQEQALFVNDQLISSFDTDVTLGDTIKIHLPTGRTYEEQVDHLPTTRPKLILFHKPVGYVVSKADKFNKTIFELLPERWKQECYYIGRLDKESSGLLLLTNDTKLVDYYEHPSHKIHKVYQVQINKPLKSKDQQKAVKGLWVTPEGESVARLPKPDLAQTPPPSSRSKYKKGSYETTPKHRNTPPPSGDNEQLTSSMPEGSELLNCVSISSQTDTKGKHRLTITLDQGKNRHIRRLLKALGYTTLKLHRIKVGKRRLGDIRPGKWKIETKRLN